MLSRLPDAGLTVKPDKVVFTTQEVSFLHHLISPSGVRGDPARTKAIETFTPTRDAKGIARFIGMENFYPKFIPEFAMIAEPLNALRKEGVKFKWGNAQQQAFEGLKGAISRPPVLKMSDFEKPFIILTDASSVALGSVLSQEVDGVRQPVASTSRALTAQERKASSIYGLEGLAVLFGTDKFRKYQEQTEFLLETDNQALSWLLSLPRQLGKIGGWVVKISSLKFKVKHVRSTQNIVADSLPRIF
jgi:hypothetical protein